ncbi:hypothetical protein ACPOL_1396 [Acidisarcina polymorpha]|uniref:Uncharacterized protein n=1 Tax=Acidisarcina polymorpha TaxID=2211140 RepID=A0A2Z5FW66_9BACT|nr:hypothetical protein ACPOL_1396 [Acidisarcina polymorpha]
MQQQSLARPELGPAVHTFSDLLTPLSRSEYGNKAVGMLLSLCLYQKAKYVIFHRFLKHGVKGIRGRRNGF